MEPVTIPATTTDFVWEIMIKSKQVSDGCGS